MFLCNSLSESPEVQDTNMHSPHHIKTPAYMLRVPYSRKYWMFLALSSISATWKASKMSFAIQPSICFWFVLVTLSLQLQRLQNVPTIYPLSLSQFRSSELKNVYPSSFQAYPPLHYFAYFCISIALRFVFRFSISIYVFQTHIKCQIICFYICILYNGKLEIAGFRSKCSLNDRDMIQQYWETLYGGQ